MRHGAMRQMSWVPRPRLVRNAPTLQDAPTERDITAERGAAAESRDIAAGVDISGLTFAGPTLLREPAEAEEEARLLLQIAAEVEGALMVQYLYPSYSVLPGLSVTLPNFPQPVLSDDWRDTIRDVAKQEMGHLVTVENLLLSLDAPPHLDRENFPIHSELYPFPFHLQPLQLNTLAEYVVAEAPRVVPAADKPDFDDAISRIQMAGGKVSRVGQIYERLYWLFQDSDAPQEPWPEAVNPFPEWPKWHILPERVGFNQDRQAMPSEWRGHDASMPPDIAVYVLAVSDKATAREAIFRVAQQGEGPADAHELDTHFDKFLRIYREFRAYSNEPNVPPFVRHQASDPTTQPNQTSTIIDAATLEWARLANARYVILLMTIALSLSLGTSGTVPGTTARRRDFITWSFSEMQVSITKLGEELRAMPLAANAAPEDLRAGLPFELPSDRDLPISPPDQLLELRRLIAESGAHINNIRLQFNPTPRQNTLLKAIDTFNSSMLQKIVT